MKNRSWISYAAIAAVLAGLFFFAYYSPRMSQLSTLSKDRQTVEQEVAKLRVQKKQMDKVEKELADLEVSLNYLESIIPKEREISDILNQFQQLAYDTRLTITKFTQKTDTPKDYYSEWPLQLEISGNYHNLGLFFDRLSRFARLFTIERFSIKPLPRQTDATTITASFTAKTYLFLDEDQIKALQSKIKVKPKPAGAKAQPAASQSGGRRNTPIKDRP
jgi:type IV pilus assembly protein PilO